SWPSHKTLILGRLQCCSTTVSASRPHECAPKGTILGTVLPTIRCTWGQPWSAELLIKPHFRHCLAVLARVAGAVVDACREIPQHNLPAAYLARKHAECLYLVPAGSQFVAHFLREAVLHHHVAATERVLRESRCFDRGLDVHFEVHQIG